MLKQRQIFANNTTFYPIFQHSIILIIRHNPKTKIRQAFRAIKYVSPNGFLRSSINRKSKRTYDVLHTFDRSLISQPTFAIVISVHNNGKLFNMSIRHLLKHRWQMIKNTFFIIEFTANFLRRSDSDASIKINGPAYGSVKFFVVPPLNN